jgi:mono-ADP-ribosyltransferase sirtuin 6
MNISWDDAKPTKTHMAISKLTKEKMCQFVMSQNIDGLHLRSGK